MLKQNAPNDDPQPIESGPLDFLAAAAAADEAIRRLLLEPCAVCNGTGDYVGLNLIEPCRSCGGAGRVARSRSAAELELHARQNRRAPDC